MPPRILCPYGEPRGAAVYCRAADKIVNALVFPCRSPRYPSCRFYRAAQEREARAGAAPGGGASGSASRAPVESGSIAVEGWSRSESERLADPLEQARILLEGIPTAGGRVRAGSLGDLVARIAERTGLSPDKCYIAVLSAGSRGDVYVKICGGRLVASASREGPVEPERLDEELRRLGEAELVVYELRGS